MHLVENGLAPGVEVFGWWVFVWVGAGVAAVFSNKAITNVYGGAGGVGSVG